MTNNKKVYLVCLSGMTHFTYQTDEEMVAWSKTFDHTEMSFTMSRVNIMTLNELNDLFIL